MAQGAVVGTVIDAETGKGVSDAIAKLELIGHPAQWAEATTDSAGKFVLHPDFRGECTIAVEKTGYVDVLAANRSARRLLAGEAADSNVSITLSPAAAATGTVFDSEGRPLTGAVVGPAVRDPVTGVTLLGEPRATVDDRGHYGLYGLAPGGYVLAVAPSQSVPARHIFTPLYFPGVTQVEQATRVRLLAGETDSSCNFVVPVSGRSSISGKIAAFAPDVRATVILYSREGYGGPLAYAYSRDGNFEFEGLNLGRYRVAAKLQPPGGDDWFGATDVDLNGTEAAKVTIQAEGAQTLRGHFQYRTGESHQDLCWRASTITARPVTAGSWMPAKRINVSPDGSFELRLSPALSYKLAVDGLDGCFVTEIRQRGASDDLQTATVDNGPVTILVSSQVSEVQGSVRSKSGPAPGAMVILAPVQATGLVSPEESAFVTAEPDGSYKFAMVPAGQYFEIALRSVMQENWTDPAFWAEHKDQAAKVLLSGGKPVQLNISLLEPRSGWR